jgi:uncharacterized protein (TIRG00374 family)
MNSHVKLFLKIAFVFGLLFFLGKKGFISVDQTQRALANWRYSLPGFLGLVLTSTFGIIRWNWLLKAHDIELPLARVFQLTYVGNFFNIALPGAVSGDFVKAFYVGKEAQGQQTKAFGSILFDRVAGLSALVVLSAAAFLVEMASLGDSKSLRAIQLLITTTAAAVILFYGYLFLVRESHDPLLRLLAFIQKKYPKLGIFAQVYSSLRHYHSHRMTVMKVLGISLLIHIIIGWSLLQFAYALGETQIPLLPMYVVFPMGVLVSSVPIMPAGVGTGNLAFHYLFELIGSQRGADIFSLFVVGQLLIGAFGGLIYLRFRTTAPAPVPSSA